MSPFFPDRHWNGSAFGRMGLTWIVRQGLAVTPN